MDLYSVFLNTGILFKELGVYKMSLKYWLIFHGLYSTKQCLTCHTLHGFPLLRLRILVICFVQRLSQPAVLTQPCKQNQRSQLVTENGYAGEEKKSTFPKRKVDRTLEDGSRNTCRDKPFLGHPSHTLNLLDLFLGQTSAKIITDYLVIINKMPLKN